MITHAPATQLNEPRPGAYSINGILGLQHDPNGNSIKRKRIDDHGKYIPTLNNVFSYKRNKLITKVTFIIQHFIMLELLYYGFTSDDLKLTKSSYY